MIIYLGNVDFASGQLIAYESFSEIRLGNGLIGSGSDAFGWSDSAWGAGGNVRYQVVNPTPALDYQIGGGAFLSGTDRAVMLTTSPEPVPDGLVTSRMLPDQNTTLFFSFVVRPIVLGTGSDTLSLRLSNGSESLALVALRPDVGQQYFNLMLLPDGGSGSYGALGSQALYPAITYLIVGRITWPFEGRVHVETWINPPAIYPGDGTGFLDKMLSSPAILNSVGLAISSTDSGGPTSTAIFDELRIGYTWSDVVLPGPPRLANISTRGLVQAGDDVMIGGFIVTGAQPKRVMLRAIGPSLPLPGQLQDPVLELYGPSGLIDSNDDWVNAPNKQEIIDSTIAPTSDFESAILTTLPANNAGYTAVVRGTSNPVGIALVEAYDLGDPAQSLLGNISTRALVQTGDDVLIGGFIVAGVDSQRIIVRAIGPSLPLTNSLADPTLDLYDSNGTLVASNDNWRDTQEAEILATTVPPGHYTESAIVLTLPPDAYTGVIHGKGGATGVALVEVYALSEEGSLSE